MSEYLESPLAGRIWMGGYGFDGWTDAVVNDMAEPAGLDKPVKPAEPTDRPNVMLGGPFNSWGGLGCFGTQGQFPGFADLPFLGIPIIWRMRAYPAIALVYAVTVGPILAGQRSTKTVRDLGKAATAEKIRLAIETACGPAREKAMPGACESLHFANWLQEIDWQRVNGLTVPADVIPVFPGEAQLHAYNRNRFTGFTIGSTTRDARYAFLCVNQPHINPVRGYSRNQNALTDWWRALESNKNADRIERKAAGIMMLLGLPIGKTFVDEDGNPVMTNEMMQGITNAAANGQVMGVPLTPFSRSELAQNPELAKVKAVQVDQFDWGDTGPALLAHLKRLDDLDRNMIRAWGRPERESTEAQKGGSRADSESHGQVGITDSELIHSSICQQWDDQVLATFIRTNFGEEWVGCFKTEPAPLADPQQQVLQQVYLALLNGTTPDPEVLASIDVRRLGERIEVPLRSEEDTQAKIQEQQAEKNAANQQRLEQMKAVSGAQEQGDKSAAETALSVTSLALDADDCDWKTIRGSKVCIGDDGSVRKGAAHLVGKNVKELTAGNATADKSKFVGQIVGKEEHEYADNIEKKVAKGVSGQHLGGKKMSHGDPADVVLPGHHIEVKTLMKGGKQSLSVHDDALMRKVDYMQGRPGEQYHTVAVDARNAYQDGEHADNYSGHRLYYKRGSGRYSLSQMHPAKSMEEVRRLIHTPDAQLPEAARGSLPSGEQIDKLRDAASRAHAARLMKDRARKARMKEARGAEAA